MKYLEKIASSFLLAFALSTTLSAQSLPPDLEAEVRQKLATFSAEHGGLFESVDPDDFRHPFEKSIREKLFADEDAKKLLPEARRVAAEFNREYHKMHKLQGVVVSERQFPELHQMGLEVSKSLGMKQGFTLYVMNSAQMNAYTWSIDQDNYGVALFSGLITGMTRDELRFVLAHEMGHVKSEHILTSVMIQLYMDKLGKLPPIFADDEKAEGKAGAMRTVKHAFAMTLAELPEHLAGNLARRVSGTTRSADEIEITQEQYMTFQRLQQASEYSSDRAGLVATADRDNSLKGLVKLASGNVGNLSGFDLASYIAQIESVLATLDRQALEDLQGQEGSHAFTLLRVGELDLFHQSADYTDSTSPRSGSAYRTVMSAYYQLAGKLQAAIKDLAKFKKSREYAEMNALARRFKERELNAVIEPRQAAVAQLSGLALDPIEKLGLASTANPAFDLYHAFVVSRGTGEPVKETTVKLVEKIQFELNRPDLDPAQRAALEARLAAAIVARDLKKKTDDDDDDESAD